jgi:hypothetical protein
MVLVPFRRAGSTASITAAVLPEGDKAMARSSGPGRAAGIIICASSMSLGASMSEATLAASGVSPGSQIRLCAATARRSAMFTLFATGHLVDPHRDNDEDPGGRQPAERLHLQKRQPVAQGPRKDAADPYAPGSTRAPRQGRSAERRRRA